MKKLFLFLWLPLLFFSCVKEPNIITMEDYNNRNAKLYYYYSKDYYNTKFYPQIATATITDTALIISASYEDVNGYYDDFNISIYTKNLTVDTTYFNSNDYNNWGITTSNDSYYDFSNYTEYTQENNSPDNYLVISEINSVNETISGMFYVNFYYGYFNELPYSNVVDSNFMLYSFALTPSNLNPNITYFVDRDEITYRAYYGSYYLEFILRSQYNGIHNFSQYYDLRYPVYTDNNNSLNTYDDPYGTYTVSDYIMNNHNYKKVVINAEIKNAYGYTFNIQNAELLIY